MKDSTSRKSSNTDSILCASISSPDEQLDSSRNVDCAFKLLITVAAFAICSCTMSTDTYTRSLDMAELHARIGKDKPFVANRLKEQVSKMIEIGILWELLPEEHRNPTNGVKTFESAQEKTLACTQRSMCATL